MVSPKLTMLDRSRSHLLKEILDGKPVEFGLMDRKSKAAGRQHRTEKHCRIKKCLWTEARSESDGQATGPCNWCANPRLLLRLATAYWEIRAKLDIMFVRHKKLSENRTKVQVVKSVREGNKVKQKVLCHVGTATSQAQLDQLQTLGRLIIKEI